MSTDLDVRRLSPGLHRVGNGLLPLPVTELSLYVHIPFCTSRCRYCNFYFETGWSPRVLDRTLDTILEESRAFYPHLFPVHKGAGKIRSVYIGGGTPSIVPPDRLDRFLTSFRSIWQIGNRGGGHSPEHGPQEFAFEANPETVTSELLRVLGNHGVDRLSVGIQSFDSGILQMLGRRAVRADIDRSLSCIMDARSSGLWQGKLNLDLIVGIPGQSVESVAEDIEAMAAAGADHISVYTLTVEDHTPLRQLFDAGYYPETPDEKTEDLWIAADVALNKLGFLNYEVSNYAKPGYESIHNTSYWEMRPYLGLGPGAVGTIPAILYDPAGTPGEYAGGAPSMGETKAMIRERAIVRLTNPDAFAYSRPGRPGWGHSVEVLGNREFLTDHFITGLRTQRGIDTGDLERTFLLDRGALAHAVRPVFDSWKSRGLCNPIDAEGKISLNSEGRALLNPLLHEISLVLDGLALPDVLPDWPAPSDI